VTKVRSLLQQCQTAQHIERIAMARTALDELASWIAVKIQGAGNLPQHLNLAIKSAAELCDDEFDGPRFVCKHLTPQL
jgi:hypothetical protein